MRVILSCGQRSVAIDGDGPLTIIGEKINTGNNPRLIAALRAGELECLEQLANRQIDAGAEVLDVHVAGADLDEVQQLPEVVAHLQRTRDVPLAIDSTDPRAVEAALQVARGKCLVNSVSGNRTSLERILPLVAEHRTAVIGLTLDEEGIPASAEGRLKVAERILEAARRAGIAAADVLIDPLVLSVAADGSAARVAVESIRRIRQALGLNIVVGCSNVSYGLPRRSTLNAAFLALAAWAGAGAVIADPIRLAMTVRAVDLLLGRDAFAARYLARHRGETEPGS